MEKLDKLKSVPSSLESERAVLGGIFLRPDIYGEVAAVISSQDFYKVGHRYIFDAMAGCYGNQESIDPLLVMNRLKKMNKFDEIGGESIFYDILEEVPTAANILSYAAIVKEKSLLRKLGTAGTKIVEMSYEGYEDVDVILDKAESLIFKIAETKDSKDLVDMRQAISDEIKRLEKVMNNKGMTTGISSGFKSFDDKTSGFHPSDLVIVAARPAMGKTALALNMALNMATHEKKGILLFSLEMSSSQLLQRLISMQSGIGLQKIRNGFLLDKEWGNIGIACGQISNSNINIADTPNVNVLEIRSIARKLKIAGQLDVIIVDYLQLIKGTGKGENRQQEISEISRSLKGIARELDVPIIALSQLSRAPEQRADRRPMLSDLRESGAIEQDADMVVFLYRDDYYNENSEEKGITEVIIGKQRNGPVGTVKLKFFNEITKFGDFTTAID